MSDRCKDCGCIGAHYCTGGQPQGGAYTKEAPVTARCAECGATIGNVGGTCLPKCPRNGTHPAWRSGNSSMDAAPERRPHDFDRARKESGRGDREGKCGQVREYEAELQRQCAALVEEAVKEEREKAGREAIAVVNSRHESLMNQFRREKTGLTAGIEAGKCVSALQSYFGIIEEA